MKKRPTSDRSRSSLSFLFRYQLLLASTQGKGDSALRGIAKLFERLEKKCWANPETSKVTLLTVEGTVLLQVNLVESSLCLDVVAFADRLVPS